MKLQKKMVTVNLAIHIDKDCEKQCGEAADKKCRFLLTDDEHCVLFDKPLKVAKSTGEKEPEALQPFLRCKPCLQAEPGS